jgi:type VI secretion system protein ImpL
MEELRLASGDNASLVKIMSDFDEFYERKYVKAWVEFAKKFDEGTRMLHGRKGWLNSVEKMSTDGNPYFSLLDRMHTELEPITHDDDFLARETVDYFYDVKSFVSTDDESGGGKNNSRLAMKALSKVGKVGKVASKIGRKAMKAKKQMDGKSPEQLEGMIENAAKTYEQYKTSLVSIAFSADSRPNSMTTTAALFNKPDDMGAGEGPVAEAEKSVLSFQMLMGKPNIESQLFWDLYTGPIRISREYMRQETACHLQDLWEKNVLAELEGVAKNKISNALIGEGGLVWNYIDNNAQAFLHKRQLRGYQSAQANGMSIPWTEEFMTFANNGSVGKNLINGEYTVRIGSLPTGVNQTAQTSPYSTILDLRCASGVQTLANYNYNSTKEFKWSLEKCGDVSLSISIGQITLRKEYKGEKGFPEFLKEFRDGHRVYVVANEFPEYVQQLHNINVRAIDVNYEINGQEPLIDILNTAPLSAPTKVAACWQ